MRALLLISIPLMLNSFIFSAYNFIDGIFVARIGSIELAAVAIIGPFFNLILSISTGLTVGGTSIIGQSVGRGEKDDIAENVIHIATIAIISGLLLLGILFFFSEAVLYLSAATERIVEVGNAYFRVLLISIPFSFANGVYIAYKSGLGETNAVLKVNLVSISAKISLSYWSIIIMKKDIVYLAYATLMGQVIITALAMLELYVNRKNILKLIRTSKLNMKRFVKIIKVSLPVIVEKSSMSYSFVMINGFVIKFGEPVLAAYGITNRINSLFFTALSGLGSGVATIVSQNIGNNNRRRALKSVNVAMVISLAMSSLFAVLILMLRSRFALIFAGNDFELYGHVIDAISVYSISVIPWGIFQIVIGYFTGTGQTQYSLIITFGRLYAFRFPSILLLSQFAFMQTFSVWIAMLLSNVLTALFALILFARMKRKVGN
ncbi:MATE family efflux transporter [Fusibacter bizertensis]